MLLVSRSTISATTFLVRREYVSGHLAALASLLLTFTKDMFWNWRTVDACFITNTWRIQSASMFAGTCIMVVLFTITHEGFRFLGKYLDRWAMDSFRDGEYCRPSILTQLVRAGVYTMQATTMYFLMMFATPRPVSIYFRYADRSLTAQIGDVSERLVHYLHPHRLLPRVLRISLGV